MHSYLKAVGFSEIKKRAEMKEILLDVIRNYDEKKRGFKTIRTALLLNSPKVMDTTAELLFAVSTMKITGFTWNIIILSLREPALQRMNR